MNLKLFHICILFIVLQVLQTIIHVEHINSLKFQEKPAYQKCRKKLKLTRQKSLVSVSLVRGGVLNSVGRSGQFRLVYLDFIRSEASEI